MLLDLGLDTTVILEDLTKRPYVMAGMAAFTLLAGLAATSTRSAMKRLGQRWVRLHRAVYAAAILADPSFLAHQGGRRPCDRTRNDPRAPARYTARLACPKTA